MSVFLRYLLFQVPGWILAAVILAVLVGTETLPGWIAGGLAAALVAKDLLVYPRLKRAYENTPTDGADAMRGSLVQTETVLDPTGYVWFGAERWRAHLTDSTLRVEAGETVRVCEVKRLTLLVEPIQPEAFKSREEAGV